MGYFMVEKKIPVFNDHLMDLMIRKGVEISGRCDSIHAHLWIPEDKEDEVLLLLKNNGFYLSETYKQRRHKHSVF